MNARLCEPNRCLLEVIMHRRLMRILPYVALAAVLALSFLAYLSPSFIVDLANRITLCF